MLPDLPRVLDRREAMFGIKFSQWAKSDGNNFPSCTFELKDTRGEASLPFSAVEDKQVAAALAVTSKSGYLARITVGTPGAPDYGFWRNAPALIVVKFPREFSVISIDTFLLEKKRSKRKSLTKERARDISIVTIKS